MSAYIALGTTAQANLPSTNNRGILFFDDADGSLKVRKTDSTIINLENVTGSIVSLGDVNINNPTTNQLLRYDGSNWTNVSFSPAVSLNDLSDVNVVTPPPFDGQSLRFNGVTQLFEVGFPTRVASDDSSIQLTDTQVVVYADNRFRGQWTDTFIENSIPNPNIPSQDARVLQMVVDNTLATQVIKLGDIERASATSRGFVSIINNTVFGDATQNELLLGSTPPTSSNVVNYNADSKSYVLVNDLQIMIRPQEDVSTSVSNGRGLNIWNLNSVVNDPQYDRVLVGGANPTNTRTMKIGYLPFSSFLNNPFGSFEIQTATAYTDAYQFAVRDPDDLDPVIAVVKSTQGGNNRIHIGRGEGEFGSAFKAGIQLFPNNPVGQVGTVDIYASVLNFKETPPTTTDKVVDQILTRDGSTGQVKIAPFLQPNSQQTTDVATRATATDIDLSVLGVTNVYGDVVQPNNNASLEIATGSQIGIKAYVVTNRSSAPSFTSADHSYSTPQNPQPTGYYSLIGPWASWPNDTSIKVVSIMKTGPNAFVITLEGNDTGVTSIF